MNKIIFACLNGEMATSYLASIKALSSAIRDVALLAVSYGCHQQAKDRIGSMVFGAIGYTGEALRAEPYLLLEASSLLQNERLFADTLPYAAGKSLTDLANIPAELADVLQVHSQMLKAKISSVCHSLRRP